MTSLRTRTFGPRAAAAALALAATSLFTTSAFAEEVQVTITTVAPADGVFLTPLWVGFHDGGFDVYDRGAAISAGLERLVEDGNTGPFSDEFAAASATGVQSTLAGPGGPIFSGDSATGIFDLDPAANRYFSYASMVIPSNDAFVANGNPLAHRVFDTDGNFTPFEFYIVGGEVLDGGTEVNDELESSTAALGQSAPDTGTDENGVVTLHPGFIPGGRILAARPNGDFTAPGQILAKVTVTRAPNTTVRFTGSGAQEVPPVETTATAACSATLNADESQITFACEHNVEDIQMAHVHLGAAGENGDVLFPFADPASPIRETFDATEENVATFLAGGLYVNLHSTAFPAGEVRAQVDGCFEGPSSVCVQGEQFEVTSTFSANGDAGIGQASSQGTDDTGFFTFFDPENIELDVKVLDGCAINGNYWVFIAGATDVGVDITVTDTATGSVQTYSNTEGNPFAVVRDVNAFSCGS
ncbi:MAG: spondin domain-containing protein [Acidobacteriota bacterium]